MNFDILVSNKCNLSCNHCCMKSRLNCKGFKLDFDFIRSQLDKYDYGTVHLAGGEPLLIPEEDMKKLIELIDEYKKRYYKFFMTSNLCLELTDLRKEFIKRVELKTSFDNGLGRFKTVKNLNRWYHNCKYIINEMKRPLDVFITYYPFYRDYERIVEFINFFYKTGFKNVLINPLMNFNEVYKPYDYDRYLREVSILDSVARSLIDFKSSIFSLSADIIKQGHGLKCNYPLKTDCICIDSGEIVNCILDPQCNCRKDKYTDNKYIVNCKYLKDREIRNDEN